MYENQEAMITTVMNNSREEKTVQIFVLHYCFIPLPSLDSVKNISQ
jgi:hypothetical protein